ncbi:calcium/calmodulin-dependent 3',5'-cyclic nucleotide phosphodiesterase 1A-like, partial [Limulus polyphemus]|uniref:Phosphodiesterase n=1 Tax=Limulus polyphemus TaxID=6850 RepID=A0ABM1BX99_LIMPO
MGAAACSTQKAVAITATSNGGIRNYTSPSKCEETSFALKLIRNQQKLTQLQKNKQETDFSGGYVVCMRDHDPPLFTGVGRVSDDQCKCPTEYCFNAENLRYTCEETQNAYIQSQQLENCSCQLGKRTHYTLTAANTKAATVNYGCSLCQFLLSGKHEHWSELQQDTFMVYTEKLLSLNDSSKKQNQNQAAQDDCCLNKQDFSQTTFSKTPSCKKAVSRLRELSGHLDHGYIPISILQKTLQYATRVLEAVSVQEFRLLTEEEDLSSVQSDTVPHEVRDWLATTFTRPTIAHFEDKPRFRSVANAIRAGIMVDRIFRRFSSSSIIQPIPSSVVELLKDIDEWSFNVFTVSEVANGQVLRYVSLDILNRYGIINKFKVPTSVLGNFLVHIELGYNIHKNPYHNNVHAADVTQTMHYMLWKAGLVNWLTDLEVFASLFAAIIHDFEHTGTTNNFHIMSGSDMALLYNDRSVLENHHLSAAFNLLKKEDCNILQNCSKEEFSIDKPKALSLILHCCDISHPCKAWELHYPWTEVLVQEFFLQGDREQDMGLSFSPLCDRNTTIVAESQIGFIDFIVAPSMQVCGDLLQKIQLQLFKTSDVIKYIDQVNCINK